MFSGGLMMNGGATIPDLDLTNLEIHMKFDNNINNEIVGGPTPYVFSGSLPEYINNTMYCNDYSDGQIRIPYVTGSGDAFSYGCWVYVNDITSQYAFFVGNTYITINYNFTTAISLFTNDKIAAVHYDGSSWATHKINSLANTPVGSWVHIMVVVDDINDYKELFINGVSQGNSLLTGYNPNNTEVRIHAGNNSSFRSDFYCNDFVLYSDALTQSQVIDVMNATNI